MTDRDAAAEIDTRDAELRTLQELVDSLQREVEKREAEICSLREEEASLAEHRLREARLQKSMLASLQSERFALLEEIDRLKSQIQASGADSARIAVRRAFGMLRRALLRRLPFSRG